MRCYILLALISGAVCGVRRQDCGSTCDKVRDLVCGSDGVTYGNLCFLKQAVCRQTEAGNFLDLAHTGACRSTDTSAAVKPVASGCDVTCDATTVDTPICGTDGVTYTNKCAFMHAQCKYSASGLRLDVAHIDRCSGAATLSGNNGGSLTSGGAITVTDKCSMTACDATKMPICGTDGNTYQNKCFFYQAQCKMAASGQKLDVAHLGACRTAASLTGTGSQTGTSLTGVSGGSRTDVCSSISDKCDSTPQKICGKSGHFDPNPHYATFGSMCEFQTAVCKWALSGFPLEQVDCSEVIG